jgi:hypothetical protein
MASFYSVPSSSFTKTNMDMPYNVPMSYQTTPPVVASSSSPLANPPFMNIFGPLKKEYCIWFYFLSLIGFILLILLLVSGIFIGITKGKGFEHYYYLFIASLAYGIFYFQNRLLYGMCSKTL